MIKPERLEDICFKIHWQIENGQIEKACAEIEEIHSEGMQDAATVAEQYEAKGFERRGIKQAIIDAINAKPKI
jgi:hypothetical protein